MLSFYGRELPTAELAIQYNTVQSGTAQHNTIHHIDELNYMAWGCKTFFMLNSADNEICYVYKKLNTNNLNIFPAKQNWAWIFSC